MVAAARTLTTRELNRALLARQLLLEPARLPIQRALVPTLARLRLRRFRTEDGQELLDLPRAPLPSPDTPAPVRFLAVRDTMLLVHARRKGVLEEEHRPLLFNSKNPQSKHTFLVDGTVAGTWRYEAGRVQLEPFGRLDRSTLRDLNAEAEGLAARHA